MKKTAVRPDDPEQLQLALEVEIQQHRERDYFAKWRARVRIIPTWAGRPGWVVAWKLAVRDREAIPRPRPACYHELGKPLEPGSWWHEDPVARLADAYALVKNTDVGEGPDWRARQLFEPRRADY